MLNRQNIRNLKSALQASYDIYFNNMVRNKGKPEDLLHDFLTETNGIVAAAVWTSERNECNDIEKKQEQLINDFKRQMHMYEKREVA